MVLGEQEPEVVLHLRPEHDFSHSVPGKNRRSEAVSVTPRSSRSPGAGASVIWKNSMKSPSMISRQRRRPT